MRYASISDRLAGLGSEKWAVHVEGRRRRAAGRQLIMLSIGEPDLAPPAAVLDAAVAAILAGRTKYSEGQGERTVRRAIAEMMTRRSGLPVSERDVVFTSGTQHAVHATLSTLVEEGDDVLVPDPFYATYDGVVAATGARFVHVPTRPEEGFHLTAAALEAAVTPASRVLLLNTPSNPTGAVLSAAELDAIGEVCARHDLWIVCDEVYATMTYGVEFCSPFDRPQLRERSVSVASISKSHALPGFRCGWAVCPPELTPRLTLVVETMLFGSQPFLADATVVALEQEHAEVETMRATFLARAEAVMKALAGSRGVRTHLPEGGMFMFLDVRPTGLSGTDFAWRLMEEQDVVVMPGESFGPGGAGHVRVALTVEADVITEACGRIVALADSLVEAAP
ncbi:MAG: pyridoxal phosphate-dependent aminotransferase [Ilumatobacteraceae bacterium]